MAVRMGKLPVPQLWPNCKPEAYLIGWTSQPVNTRGPAVGKLTGNAITPSSSTWVLEIKLFAWPKLYQLNYLPT